MHGVEKETSNNPLIMSSPPSSPKPAPSSSSPPPPEDHAVPQALGVFGVGELSPFDEPPDVLPRVSDPRFQNIVGDDACWIPAPPAGPPVNDVPERPLDPRMNALAGDGFDIERIKTLLPELASTDLPDHEAASVPATETVGHAGSEQAYTSRSPRMEMDEMVVDNIFEDRQLGQYVRFFHVRFRGKLNWLACFVVDEVPLL